MGQLAGCRVLLCLRLFFIKCTVPADMWQLHHSSYYLSAYGFSGWRCVLWRQKAVLQIIVLGNWGLGLGGGSLPLCVFACTAYESIFIVTSSLQDSAIWLCNTSQWLKQAGDAMQSTLNLYSDKLVALDSLYRSIIEKLAKPQLNFKSTQPRIT